MAHQALHRRVIDTLDFSRESMPSLLVEEVMIEPGSELTGRPVVEAVGRARALAVARGTQVITPPDSDLRLQAGDRLLLLGDRETLRPIEGD